ncbi:MAG TPA: ABC-F family ATP-binding cassette domain-containing protein [Propionicimonas sp.]|uniref:ABC-F family ATP-binding cassette domain-containing protein n=1 Tax=Propionicimonas sp. TaxID=1955623 RepID=UPI002F413CF3
MPASLFLTGVAASFGARPLFSGLDLTLTPGDVTALVGPNGSGKTTLLRIVAGEHAADAGTVHVAPPDATVGYLPQSPPRAAETILEYVRRRTGVAAAQHAFEQAAAALADQPDDGDAYTLALDRWLGLGGTDLEVRLAEVLARVGLDVALDRPLGSLSGGQASRAGLASILVSRYDLLLLDEPTNNLDLAGVAAITDFVHGLAAPVLVASHDRAFLDDVATSVLELDLPQQAVNHYTGGWSEYRAARALARSQAEAAYETYAGRRENLAAQARRKTEWAREGRAKSARLGPGMKLEKKYREDRARRMDQRAARVRDAVERLQEVEQPRREWELRYTITEAPAPADVVLTLDQVVARNGTFAVGPVSAQVGRGERVALVGPNGSGKTTLLAGLLGERPFGSGRSSWGTRVALGRLDQSREAIGGSGQLLEQVMAALGTTDAADTRTLLAKFGLGAEHVARAGETLSLGERTRAALAVLQGRAVNVVVLDEPTNHLDVSGIEQLQAALVEFTGTLLIVTHDRALLAALAPSQTWDFTRTGDSAAVRVNSSR